MIFLSNTTKAQETGIAPGEIAGTLHKTMNPVKLFGLMATDIRVKFRTADESVASFLKRLKDGGVRRITDD